MFGYDLTVFGLSIGAGYATRHYVAKAFDSIPGQARTGAKIALSLAAGVGAAVESGDPLLSAVVGVVATGAMWFLLNQISDYVKPVVSNALGLAVAGGGLYAGYGLFSGNSTTRDDYNEIIIGNSGAATGSTLPVDPHHHGHMGL